MKTVKEYKERLCPKYAEALDSCCRNDDVPLSPREALDIIVRYEGGIATGYEINCLVTQIWGVRLPESEVWDNV